MTDYSNIVILTGAGISAESGVQTFRAQDGLWEQHRIEDVATPEAFERDPLLVNTFYNMRRQPLLDNQVAPNAAHYALAKLEQEFGGTLTVITQNIDNLHEQAGSVNVLHMHGELLKMRCRKTDQLFPCDHAINIEDLCPCCDEAGNLRPHIVWFGETPLYMDEIFQVLAECDLFVAIGTSGNVYPAASFVQIAEQAGATTLEMNLEESAVASDFDQTIYAPAGISVPQWVDQLLTD